MNTQFMGTKLMFSKLMFSLASLVIREMQIETKMQYLLILVSYIGKIINDYSHCC